MVFRNFLYPIPQSRLVSVTAPFTQGSLGRYRARAFFDTLKYHLKILICFRGCFLYLSDSVPESRRRPARDPSSEDSGPG